LTGEVDLSVTLDIAGQGDLSKEVASLLRGHARAQRWTDHHLPVLGRYHVVDRLLAIEWSRL
jgi:hypothetical protein